MERSKYAMGRPQSPKSLRNEKKSKQSSTENNYEPFRISNSVCFMLTVSFAGILLIGMCHMIVQQRTQKELKIVSLKQKLAALNSNTAFDQITRSINIATTAKPIPNEPNSVIVPVDIPTKVNTIAIDIVDPTKPPKLTKKGNNKPTKPKPKGKRPKDPYDFVLNIDNEWGFHGEHKWIVVLPTPKMNIKKDRRVIFPNITITKPARSLEPSTHVVGNPRELVKANEVLKRHPMHQFAHSGKDLEDVMFFVKNTESCRNQPVFLSMATVHDDLYWQLIENFVYTMVKFGLSDCSLVICVSDPKCMKMCDDAFFPCYNYQEHTLPLPSVMEQIAAVKLLHVPKALSRGVDVFMLDLDVGFLEDPSYMVQAFVETPIVDIMVQEDYIFIMNRTKAGWKTWFTEPLPNIGLFLCRGNNRTARVFEMAWAKYLKMSDPVEKSMPGKDQNHVLDAMRIGRGNYGLKYAYFSNSTAPLLDKLVLNHGNVMELGGELMAGFLHTQKSIAMHTTCYEKSTKVMGLKATNSFWNPRYYDPLRPTITKQILFLDASRLLDEVRSLVWLAISTQRSLIIPNILGNEGMRTIAPYKGQVMWPGFRVAFLKRDKGKNQLKVTILEPAYYWRVERDYDEVPVPHVIYFSETETLGAVRSKVENAAQYPRIVLHHATPPPEISSGLSASEAEAAIALVAATIEREVIAWANDSVGIFSEPWTKLVRKYRQIPSVKTMREDVLTGEVLQGMRNCAKIFGGSLGNRTCFQICD